MSSAKQRKLLPLLILVVVAAAAILLLTMRPAPEARPQQKPKPPALSVVYAEPTQLQAVVRTQGTVRPKWEIDLVAEASGRVIRVTDNFVNGGFFEKGDELIQIEPVEYEVALARAEAAVAQAERNLAQERGQARLAQREWRELGNSEANELFLRKPQIAAAEAELKKSKVELAKAKLDLERTTVRAPFSGRLLEANVQVGDQVGNGANLGKAFSTDVMEIPLPLTSGQIGLVDLPLHAKATIDIPVRFTVEVGGRSHHWQGHIVRTEASFDTQSRVVYAIAEVAGAYMAREDGAPPLAPGMFAYAEVEGKLFQNAIEVPRNALYERNNLLTLDEQNRLQVTPVTVVQSEGEKALVVGISAGTAVLLEKPTLLIHGMEVRPVGNEQTAREASLGLRGA
ncbi:efflux RND transporter periplasmic adaptor subunit [Porticoccaceae bacterium LTM1]|nr:efflux RND transporter periplasmic adaptor subunit [Porticoccaceae bacterium LTM1]